MQATNFVRLIGTSFTIPAGVAYANLGPMKVGIISLVLSTIGVLLMWSCTMATEFFSSNAWLFGFFSLLAGTNDYLTQKSQLIFYCISL